MRAAARRLLEQFETGAEKVNALERPYEASADTIPYIWTAGHCSRRIVEAFETLAKLPRDRGPKPPGGCWPAYTYDQADRNVQEIDVPDDEKKRRRIEQNRTVVRATGEQLRQMDCVLDWLCDLHAEEPLLCVIVQQWAVLRSSGRNVKDACRERGVTFQTFYRAKGKAVEIIVDRLNAIPVPVF